MPHPSNFVLRVGALFVALLLVVFAAGLTLDYGTWTRSETIRGPFATETMDSRFVLVPVAPGLRWRPLLDVPGDLEGRGNVSDLRLSVMGETWATPHAPHAILRNGVSGAYSHWNRHLYFYLPPALPNDDTTTITVTYSVKLAYGLLVAIGIASILSTAGLIVLAVRADPQRGWRRVHQIAGALPRSLLLASGAIVAIAAIYLATIFWGAASGHALPTASIFRIWPTANLVWDKALFASHAMVVAAGIGAASAWLATLGFIASEDQQRLEAKLTRLWIFAGVPVVALCLLFQMSGGGWSGRFSPLEYHYMSLAGLVPFSDAHTYYAAPFEAIYQAQWNAIAAQRPLAAAARSVVFALGGYSYSGTLIVQAMLIGAATVLAARAVARSYGLWPALAFTAFAMGLARPFLITVMTEPIALVFALVSVAFFVEALRLKSGTYAVFGFAMLCTALFVRMGSMFTLPALLLAIPLLFEDRWRQRFQLFACLLGVFGMLFATNLLLAQLFSAQPDNLGGNFAYVICGLARGTGWSECNQSFAAALAALGGDPKAQNQFLWQEAFKAIANDPSIFLWRLWAGTEAYLTSIPRFFMIQYVTLFWPQSNTVWIISLVFIPGILYFISRRGNVGHVLFYVFFLASIAMSAAFVFLDDGGRVLTATHIFVALMISIGLSTPRFLRPALEAPTIPFRVGLAGVVGVSLLLAIVPSASRAFGIWTGSSALAAQDTVPSVHLVPPRPALTGFVVVPDGAELGASTPTIHASTFAAILAHTKLEQETGAFLKQALERMPFAFVTVPRIGGRNQINLYVGPVSLLIERPRRGWRLKLRTGPTSEAFWHSFYIVQSAEPID